MTASPAAAVFASDVRVADPAGMVLAVSLVVTGGLVEGVVVGVWQSLALRQLLGRTGRLRWVVATVAVAGFGCAAGSVPSVLGNQSETPAQPSWPLILAGAAGLGLVMGAVLGLVQALVIRGRVEHAFRWVSISAVGWAPAMMVIFAGASAPSASWHAAAVVGFGSVTGALAGFTLGVVTGLLLPGLSGQPPHNLLVMALLRSPLRALLAGRVVGLRLPERRSGAPIEFPVMYARDRQGMVVVPGHAERKTWWRLLRRVPRVHLLVDGRWEPGTAVVLGPRDTAYRGARTAYLARFPRAGLPDDQPIVRVQVAGDPSCR